MSGRLVLVLLFVPLLASADDPASSDRLSYQTSGGVTEYLARRGDSLSAIGARFGVDAATLAADNGVANAHRVHINQRFQIDNRHIIPALVDNGILVINVPQRMLFYRQTDGVLAAYPVAVGRSTWQTPSGPFTIVTKEEHPTWDVPPSILEESRRTGRHQPARVPPGPHNPLGDFWIGLSIPGFGIHGTVAPSSIYRAATHGCIRLHPDDITRLFPQVQIGTRGRFVYEPVLLALVGGRVYLEVHPDMYRRLRGTPGALIRALALGAGLTEQIDWQAVDRVIAAREGVARAVGTAQTP